MFKKSETVYWIWMALKLNNQNTVFQHLLDVFGNSALEIYRAKRKELEDAGNLNEKQISALCDKDIGEAMSIFNYCNKNGVGILTYDDPLYPESVKNMKNPPILLYYMGKFPNVNRKLCISVVGTRKMTEYGMRSAYKISYELASAGTVIVSGMALGIDSVASAGAISARGTTIAVLGCGIDVIYPKQHRRLRKIICENGAVVTAYHPSTPAYRTNFPERNAIISAFSAGTLIVEAPMRSGAMLTAEDASEQSRVVYALPGSIEEPTSEGPNHLIKEGAVAVTCARDILQEYFEDKYPYLDPVRFRQGEFNSEFDPEILESIGVSTVCSGKGPVATPAALLKKLNEKLNNNEKENSDYYAVPKIRRLSEREKSEATSAEACVKVNEAVLDSLDEEQKKIYSEFPIGKPVSVDYLSRGGYNIGNLMAALTILEIKGLISSLPGGLYIRK